jgi:prolyl oligopeptidase
MNKLVLAASAFLISINVAAKSDDPFLWLEDVEGKQALDWVKAQNKVTESELGQLPMYQSIYDDTLAVMDSKHKITSVKIRGDKVYNMWKDGENVRGLYREANLDDYLAGKPKWQKVFSVDELAKTHGKNWVFDSLECLYPEFTRCLLGLSIGGADAIEVKEFDLIKRDFVKGGFTVAEAKQSISWRDIDHLYIGTDFGQDSMTDSGYPRMSKLWKRGTPLKSAKLLFTGKKESVSAGAYRIFGEKGHHDVIYESKTFYTRDYYLIDDDKQVTVVMPDSASIAGFNNNMIFVELKSDWHYKEQQFIQGSYITASVESVKKGAPDYQLFLEPEKRKIIKSISFSKNYIWVNWLENVKSRLERFSYAKNGSWNRKVIDIDSKGRIAAYGFKEENDNFFINYESFLQPDTLYYVEGQSLKLNMLQQLPHQFDASKFVVEQHEVKSLDGTLIPYFLLMPKALKKNGKNPTLLYGYGGFEVSLQSNYSGVLGTGWLERGGVYVLSNIRGGGEFGPAWHQSALKENRHKAYEDFEAIARDLIAKKITSPQHLGAMGGSNGGLLMGNMLTRSPELFNAIVCAVPLLDMLRYNKLLAGASWMGEYGNPDIEEEWAYIKTFSPYHMLKKNTEYPRALFTTSTRDDRVHPGHARKMVAKMLDMDKDVLYYENMEGGHGGAANNKQSAHLQAMIYSYLFARLQK